MTDIVTTTPEEVDRAVVAIHDMGTRSGATPKKVMAALKKAGFSYNTIVQAVKKFGA
jgi:uncharacterized protein